MKRCADKFGFGRLLTDLLYPRRCAICDEVLPMGEGLICRGHNSLPYVKTPSCMVCGKEVDSEERELCLDCEKHSRNFERGFPVFNYVEPVKASVLAIKYHNKKEYCDFYGAQMAEKVRPYVRRYGIDAVTCVPLHRRKQRQRGYNQAAVLAKVVADELGLPFCEDMLVRRKYTTPQKKLDNLERANNIKTSMDIGRVYPEYRNILLVDDIYTTGVTIDVCAGLLKKAAVSRPERGARVHAMYIIHLYVLARGVSPRLYRQLYGSPRRSSLPPPACTR